MSHPQDDTLLSVRDLSVRFDTPAGAVRAVDDVSFDLARGETLCIVGESGSGKSVTARAIMQIVDRPGVIDRGSILFAGESGRPVDIATLPPKGRAMRALRGASMSMIFQEPMSSLSPVHTVGDQIGEVLRLHQGLSRKQARAGVIEALGHVGIPDPAANVDRYPFEYSGGMRQRVMIAMAIVCRPRLVIADEPTTALDVTTQADILDLLMRIRHELGVGMLFITHDLGVVAEIADRVMVMNNGKRVELGTTEQVLTAPEQPYSRALIGAVRRLERRAPSKVEAKPPSRPAILDASGITVEFAAPKRWFSRMEIPAFRAVDAVSFQVHAGETLGIVGESGSGKTTLARSILRIVEPSAGTVTVRPADGREILVDGGHRANLRRVRRVTRFVFQDPYASLNPRMTVAQILAEPLHAHGMVPDGGVAAYVKDLLHQVGLPASVASRYPHAFSGGQRQRIGIARALALQPEILIADEATSALDVSLRAHMLDLLIELQNRLGLTYVFITHDMGVVRYFCDKVAVMRRGAIVEFGPVADVCERPQDPYTKTLLASVPLADPRHLSARGASRRDRFAGRTGAPMMGQA